MSEWKTIEQIWNECEGKPVWIELTGETSKSLLYRKDENEYWLVERDNCVFILGHLEARIYQEPKKQVVKWQWVFKNLDCLQTNKLWMRSEMKTLQQLYEENGSKFPFRVLYGVANDDYWHEFHYEANGYFYGHEKCTDGIKKCVTATGYKLYTEPKPKIKFWPYLVSSRWASGYCNQIVYLREDQKNRWFRLKPYPIPHPTLPPVEIEKQDE